MSSWINTQRDDFIQTYILNHRDQQKLSPTKKSIFTADYTIAYTQTGISQEFSSCAIPYYRTEHLMTHKILSFVGNIYQDFSTVTIWCCVAKVEKF
jgi:hypothetical protein